MSFFKKITKKSFIDLTKYSHNRHAHYKVSGNELLHLVDDFADQDELSIVYNHFEKTYSLPKKVVKQKLKQNIIKSYKYKEAKFRKELGTLFIFRSIFKFYGSLLYALINSVKLQKRKYYKLIIDDICSSHELERFYKLIKLVKKENILCVITNDTVRKKFPDYNVVKKSFYKNYNRIEVLNTIRHEFVKGFLISLKVSLKTKVNLFPTTMLIIKDYLCYLSLFQSNSSDYIIQERHYNTNAIKNYLFKKMGGIASTTIQKNILQLDQTIYYMDSDCFFSLGKRTAERAFQYGANIDRVVPVGSLFMEHYWFSNLSPLVKKKSFDIVMIGINVMNAYNRMDSYTEFMDDYYNSIRWLVRFKKEYPQYQIVIKHHQSASEDEIETKILYRSGIKVFKDGNSYEVAFASQCAVTFGSTMGFELNAHGLTTFFFDPGYRCSILPDKKNDPLWSLRVQSYEELRTKLLNVMSVSKVKVAPFCIDEICLDSSSVSIKIYNEFMR